MNATLPKIQSVTVIGSSALQIHWDGCSVLDRVELSEWIATGGDILAPLREAEIFARAARSDHGAAVSWDRGEGDLSIDAFHLKQLIGRQSAKD